MAEQEPGRRDYNQSHWCVNLMDISPPPPHTHTPPSSFLYVSLRFITLCFFFFYYKAPREDIYVHVHFSWNSLSAGLPVATLHSLKVISSLIDKTRIWGTVSHPLSQMRKTGDGMTISTLWHQKKAATEIHNLCEAFLISEREEIWILFSFSIFIVKNIGNICESRESSSQGTFFKQRLV